MRYLVIVALLLSLINSNEALCQKFYDDISLKVDSLLNERLKILSEIEKLDKIILDSISTHGYYIRYGGTYDGVISDTIGFNRKTLKTIKNGDLLLVVGKVLGSDIYKIRLDNGTIGYHVDVFRLISALADYPVKVLHKIDYFSNNSSTTNCSSSQCSATTSRGARCKNRTTNCNGRCHLH